MREEAIKVFGLENSKKESGSFELGPQMLINYAIDTVFVPDDLVWVDIFSQTEREKWRSVAIHQSWWCKANGFRFMQFPHFHSWSDEFPRLSENLEEIVVLAVPETSMLPPHSMDSNEYKMGMRPESKRAMRFKRRVWARDTRYLEEVKDLWEQMSILLGIEYSSKVLNRLQDSRDWTTIKEDLERGWSKVCENYHSRGFQMWKDVKILRAVVDENSVRGGKMVFEKMA